MVKLLSARLMLCLHCFTELAWLDVQVYIALTVTLEVSVYAACTMIVKFASVNNLKILRL